MSWPTCSTEGCDRGVRSRGLCAAHYQRLVKGQDIEAPIRARKPPVMCAAEGCDRPADSRGYCGTHYVRSRRGNAINAPVPHRMVNEGRTCSFGSCERPARTRGLCSAHYQRQLRGKPMDPPHKKDRTRYVSRGYVMVATQNTDGTRRVVAEHRLVMESILGRRLLSNETVHHRNGVRDDNRPENLELWSSHHHPGQRVVDLLQWARTILDEYEPVEDRLAHMGVTSPG